MLLWHNEKKSDYLYKNKTKENGEQITLKLVQNILNKI